VVLAEIAKAEAVQVALVGGVAERTEIGVVRRLDPHRAARAHQAVKFLHGADDVAHVLDRVNGGHAVERTVGERVRQSIQVHQHVGAAGGVPVDSDRTGLLANPAADVEYSHPKTRSKILSTFRSCRSRENALAICSGASAARISGSASIAARKSPSSSQARMAWACTTR